MKARVFQLARADAAQESNGIARIGPYPKVREVTTMRRLGKCLLGSAVLMAACLILSPQSANAAKVVVRARAPGYRAIYVYRYPTPVRYYAPAPVLVYPRHTIVYGPPLVPAPLPPRVIVGW
jgi:hypothetical protein